MKYILSLSILVFALSCSSNKHEVKKIDDKMVVKGKINNSYIGVDEKGQAIIREEVAADDALRVVMWKNSKLEQELDTEQLRLKSCRNDIADRRLGGIGKVREIPQIDNMKDTSKMKESLGIKEDGSLKFVKKEFYLDRLNAERKYNKSLKTMNKTVVNVREQCERDMGQARIKAGLPAKRYEPIGRYDRRGRWKMIRKGERSLDDAFEIAASSKR